MTLLVLLIVATAVAGAAAALTLALAAPRAPAAAAGGRRRAQGRRGDPAPSGRARSALAAQAGSGGRDRSGADARARRDRGRRRAARGARLPRPRRQRPGPAGQQRGDWGDRHASAVLDRRPERHHRPGRARGRRLARRAPGARRDGADPEPVGRARSCSSSSPGTASSPRRSRTSPTACGRAEPRRRDARALVPERPLVLVGSVLRRGGASAQPRSRPPRAGGDRRGRGGARRDGRRQPRAAQRALAERRDRRPGARLGLVLDLRVAFGGRLLRFGAPAEEAARAAQGRGLGGAHHSAGTSAAAALTSRGMIVARVET